MTNKEQLTKVRDDARQNLDEARQILGEAGENYDEAKASYIEAQGDYRNASIAFDEAVDAYCMGMYGCHSYELLAGCNVARETR